MSKRTSSTSIGTVGLIAFIALFVSALCFLIEGISSMFEINMGSIPSILSLIGRGCLLASVLLAAHAQARKMTQIWYIIYWVLAVLAILGFFGVCKNFL